MAIYFHEMISLNFIDYLLSLPNHLIPSKEVFYWIFSRAELCYLVILFSFQFIKPSISRSLASDQLSN